MDEKMNGLLMMAPLIIVLTIIIMLPFTETSLIIIMGLSIIGLVCLFVKGLKELKK